MIKSHVRMNLNKFYRPLNMHKLKKQCKLFWKDLDMDEVNSDDSDEISSVHASDKIYVYLLTNALTCIMVQRFTKFQQISEASYADTRVDEIINSLASYLNGVGTRKDYFICSEHGYGLTNFMSNIASKADEAVQSLKWWVSSSDFAEETNRFLARISLTTDAWMSYTQEEYEDDLIARLKDATKDVQDWLILINGFNDNNLSNFDRYFGSFTGSGNNGFVISSNDCSLYDALSEKFAKYNAWIHGGIVSRELIKIELQPNSIDEA